MVRHRIPCGSDDCGGQRESSKPPLTVLGAHSEVEPRETATLTFEHSRTQRVLTGDVPARFADTRCTHHARSGPCRANR